MGTFKLPKDLGPGFLYCVLQTFDTDELVQQFNRLYSCSLNVAKTPIERLVDDATGKLEGDIAKFVNFVHECVWTRLDHQTRTALTEEAMSNIADDFSALTEEEKSNILDSIADAIIEGGGTAPA